jgi:hypothetical protein
MDKLEAKAADAESLTIALLEPVPAGVEPSEAFRAALRQRLLRYRFRLLPPVEDGPPLAA